MFDEMSQKMYALTKNLTALSILRILEARAEHATLQIMLWFSWSMACVKSGSNQWLTTLDMEALRLR
jgi:hypothetical protein